MPPEAPCAEPEAPVVSQDAAGSGASDAVPWISIVTPCRDGMPFLPFAVADMARNTGVHLEMLVCDDGSKDGSKEWLAALSAELGGGCEEGFVTPDPIRVLGNDRLQGPDSESRSHVKDIPWDSDVPEDHPPTVAEVAQMVRANGHRFVFLSSGGGGQGSAQNLCLQKASCQWLSLMDADDRCPETRFRELYDALKANPAWDGVVSQVKIFGIVSDGMNRYVEWQNSIRSPEAHLNSRFVEIPALHQTGLYPTSLIRDSLGGYRDLPSWPIDIDTWMRLGELGVKIGKIDRPLYGWRQHFLQSTRTHGRCSLESLRKCKAHFLKRILPADVDRMEVWSTGATLQKWHASFKEVEDTSRPVAVDLIEYSMPGRKRGGAKRRSDGVPVEDVVEIPTDKRTEVGECKGHVARLFVFGSDAIRQKIRGQVEKEGRMETKDWFAA